MVRVQPPRRVVLWPDAPVELLPARPVPDDPAKVPPDELAGWISEAYGVPLERVFPGAAMVPELVRLAGVRLLRFVGLWRGAVLPVRLDWESVVVQRDGGVEVGVLEKAAGLCPVGVLAALVREESGWRPYWRPRLHEGAHVPSRVPAVPALFWIGDLWEGAVPEAASGDVRRGVLGARGVEAWLEALRGCAVRVRLPDVGWRGSWVRSEPFRIEEVEAGAERFCLRGPGPVCVEFPVGVERLYEGVGWDFGA
ncbi:MAG: hypothetical protein AB1609_22760 [Bacillota bacterium]